jgi:hypothetical protein
VFAWLHQNLPANSISDLTELRSLKIGTTDSFNMKPPPLWVYRMSGVLLMGVSLVLLGVVYSDLD